MKKQLKLSANEFVILAYTYGYSTKEAAQKYVEEHPKKMYLNADLKAVCDICKRRKNMNNINVYTVEEEEASCLMCEHVCEKEDWCEKYCGPKHGWNHYERLEFVEKAEDK